MHKYRITIKLKIKPVSKKKRVAIIGSGPAGLVSAKYALESDFVPVVFDKKHIPGGLWSAGTAIWDDMHTNVSRFSVMFSDFPWPSGTSLIPSAKEVHEYLLAYIRHFQLDRYFCLNANVESVRQLANKKWQLVWTNYLTGERITEMFDHIIVSTGLHSKPSRPFVENADKFRGLIMHSNEYRSSDERLRNKRVIVVGNSYSGVEIASHLVGHAATVTNVFNRPYLVFPRLLKIKCKEASSSSSGCCERGPPGSEQQQRARAGDQNGAVNDVETNRAGTVAADDDDVCNIMPIDLLFGRELTFTKHRTPAEERQAKIDLYRQLCPHQTDKSRSLPCMYYELDDDEPIREAVTDNYYPYVLGGQIVPRQARLERFDKYGVLLSDGTYERADAVIFCTGYKLCMSYFDASVLATLKYDPGQEKIPIVLYKYTVHPDLENLAMVGEIAGLFFAGFENQAKWVFKLFRGERQLPERHLMEAEMRQDEQLRDKQLNNQYPHGIYNELIDTLAVEAGCMPDIESAARDPDPALYRMLWKNGTIPSHFCFNEKSKREVALAQMREVDDIISQKYTFSARDYNRHGYVSTSTLAQKLAQRYKIPMHLFKD